MRDVARFALTLGFTGFVAASCGGAIATSSPFADEDARAPGGGPSSEPEAGADALPPFTPPQPTPPRTPPPPDGGPLPRIACGDAGARDASTDASPRRDGGVECPTTTVCANDDYLLEYQGGACEDGVCVYRGSTLQYCGSLCRCVMSADGAACGQCVIPI